MVLGYLLGCRSNPDDSQLDQFIASTLKGSQTPGIAACVVKEDEVIWSGGYGWADIAARKRMTPDTLLNIASISKTVTATAIMQLWEEKKFGLDDDIGDYLSFSVRNPRYADTPITFRQLLTHSSSINDGPSYISGYACGDPTVRLMDWLYSYFDLSGENYDAKENFHPWEPGSSDVPEAVDPYSNLGFGLLGGLVESISDMAFAKYCKERIFEPLGMKNTAWYIDDIDKSQHAIPYSAASGPRFLTISGDDDTNPADDSDYYEHCLYSFPNYPDGGIRTSVNQLSRFLRAYIGQGEHNANRILRASTVRSMLSHEHFGRGLCWSEIELQDGNSAWGHSGGDPGVSTYMGFNSKDNRGVIVFANYDGDDRVGRIAERLIRHGQS